jgi:DNA-binding NtrC family response regulator
LSQLARASGALTSSLAASVPDVSFFVVASAARELWPRLFREYHAHRLAAPLIAVLASDDSAIAERALRCGATDFLMPPIRPHELLPRLRCAWTWRPKGEVSAQQLKETPGLNQLVGDSPAFLAEIRKIPAIARADTSVLILGETGTGKEICARAIHYLSPRTGKPFVPVNCGAMPVELFENELFGHETGAFTGANAASTGLIQTAQGGTLFLDEVDALPLAAQAALLRFLQDKEFMRLGSAKVRKADVRVIAATNIQLYEAVSAGRFRPDLFYRLNVLSLELPPLRARGEDIVLLARHLQVKLSAQQAKPMRQLSPAALRKLLFYDWPGNVRELENVIARAVTLSDRTSIGGQDICLPQSSAKHAEESFEARKAALIEEFETQYVSGLLLACSGNVSQAAHAAGKERTAFKRLLRKHRIEIPQAATSQIGSGASGRPDVHTQSIRMHLG